MTEVKEVLEVAEHLEAMAAAAYRKAAACATHEQFRDSLLELAAMEERHLETLRRIRGQVTAEPAHLAEGGSTEAAEIVSVWLEDTVFPSVDELSEASSLLDSIDGWLETTIAMEKESIAYYSGLRLLLTDELGAEVEKMIHDELHHLVSLGRLMRTLQAREADAT